MSMTVDEVRAYLLWEANEAVAPPKAKWPRVVDLARFTLLLLDEHEAPIDCCGEWEPGPCKHCDARTAVQRHLEEME